MSKDDKDKIKEVGQSVLEAYKAAAELSSSLRNEQDINELRKILAKLVMVGDNLEGKLSEYADIELAGAEEKDEKG